MARRPRKYIPYKERLAAALSCLLTQKQRDELRGLTCERTGYLTAQQVISMFDFDHVVLHTHGGANKWSNLTPMLRRAHREKSRRDTAVAAKVKRLAAEHEECRRRILAVRKIKRKSKYSWPKRKLR